MIQPQKILKLALNMRKVLVVRINGMKPPRWVLIQR